MSRQVLNAGDTGLSARNKINQNFTELYGTSTNIRTHGAVGDGVTDDTEAIAAALAASSNVFVPSGTYLISDIITKTLASDFRMTGEAGSKFIFEDAGGFVITNTTATQTLAANVNRGDTEIDLVSASGLVVGDVIRLASTVVAEVTRNRPHRFLGMITSISGNTVTVDRPVTLNFHIGDAGLSVLSFRPNKVDINTLKFESDASVLDRYLKIYYSTPRLRGLTFKGPEPRSGQLTFITGCYDVLIEDTEYRDCLYGVLLDNSSNIHCHDIKAYGTRHPLLPTFFCTGVYVDGLTGNNNETIVDSHEAFDVHYKNVYCYDSSLGENNRCIGGGISDSILRMADSFVGPEMTFATSPHNYSTLYNEYDYYIRNCKMTVDNPIAIDIRFSNTVLIDSCNFEQYDGTPAGIQVSYQVNNAVNSLILSGTNRFSQDLSKIRCKINSPESGFRLVNGINHAVSYPTYTGSIVGSLTVTTGGTGYSNATGVALTGGTGSGATVDITTSGGAVTVATVASLGSGYTTGDVLTISGGGANATVTITDATRVRDSFLIDNLMNHNSDRFTQSTGMVSPTLVGTSDYVFAITWPVSRFFLNDLANSNGYNYTDLTLDVSTRHSNSGLAEHKTFSYFGRFGLSNQNLWTTPAFESTDTGQANTTMTCSVLRSLQTGTTGKTLLATAIFRVTSGRTSPFFGTYYKLTQVIYPT